MTHARQFLKNHIRETTKEIFRIAEAKATQPSYYKIEDLSGEKIIGVFYNHNLVKVSIEPNERIGEVLKERKKGQHKEYFIHFFGEPDSNNKWVKEGEGYNFI